MASDIRGCSMIGAIVELQNLTSQPELNDSQGTVVSEDDSGRWDVQLENNRRISVTGKHLVIAGITNIEVGPCGWAVQVVPSED